MSLPKQVREEVRRQLWEAADTLGWTTLSPQTKARHYENWTREDGIGGVLSRYMDKGKVRVYIKDTLLKAYTREASADHARPLRLLGVESSSTAVEKYIKPHGVRLADGKIVAWGKADDWKAVLLALHERAWWISGATCHGAVLMNATGRYDEPKVCSMVEAAANRLGILRVVWLR